MSNQILKMVFEDIGDDAISFIKVSNENVLIITYHSANKMDWGGVESESVLDSYVMKNNDDTRIIELIERAKKRAVSCEEISEKAFDYSIKELSEKQLKYLLS